MPSRRSGSNQGEQPSQILPRTKATSVRYGPTDIHDVYNKQLTLLSSRLPLKTQGKKPVFITVDRKLLPGVDTAASKFCHPSEDIR